MKTYFYLLSFLLLSGLFMPLRGFSQGPGKSAFIMGENMRKQNRCEDAIAKYDEAIKLEPSNYRYYFSRGKCEYQLKQFDRAKESFRSTVEYKQDYSPAYSLLAKLYKNENNLDDAIYYYEQAARYERDNKRKVQYMLLLINMLLKEDRTSEARRFLSEARSLDPDNPNILFYTAEMASLDKDWEGARRDYERALESDKLKDGSAAEKAKYYYGLGVAYNNLGDNANARRAWAKANFGPYKKLIEQQMMKTSHVYYYKIALSYYINGEYQESERFIEQSLDLQRDFSRAYILNGKIETKRGNISRAIDYYQQAIDMEKDPQMKAKMYSLVASLQLSNNDAYGALASVDRALAGNPGNSSLLYMRARAEYGAGRFRDAIVTLDQLLTSGVDTKSKAKYSFMKGMAARKAGDNETAKKAFMDAMYGPYKPAAAVEIEKINGKG